MSVKQISVPMKDEPGALHGVTEVLKLEGVNIRAIAVSAPGEEPVVRMMVDDPERATNALAASGFSFDQEEVIAVEVPDHPGGLHAVLGSLKDAGINVRQLYSYLGATESHAILILAVDRPDEARSILEQNWVCVLGDEVYER